MIDGEIWIIDDDRDDHELVQEIVKELNVSNGIRFFSGAPSFFAHMEQSSTAPFIILCDVNLPGLDGFGVRSKLLESDSRKHHSVPFIFWSNSASDQQIERAYRMRAHGFFVKEANFKEWKETFGSIIRYWRKSKMPSKVNAHDRPMA